MDIRTCSKSGGCGAKLGPGELKVLFEAFTPKRDPNLLVGIETSDDAGVYLLSRDLAQIHTADVITPVTSDPYMYGQVAAANALSDVYAMGGKPLTALNLCFFPETEVSLETLGRILAGGLSKIEESGALLVGGHSVRDSELKYGLSVTGLVHPDNVVRNSAAKPGDHLILTKSIGTGVHITASKQGKLDDSEFIPVVESMSMLNAAALEVMIEFGVRACTDITGFGLAGHSLEMARGSNVSIDLYLHQVPLFPQTLNLLRSGIRTSLTPKNREFTKPYVKVDSSIDPIAEEILYDPQTSGGLLLAVAKTEASSLVSAFHERGITSAQIIGECKQSDQPHLRVF